MDYKSDNNPPSAKSLLDDGGYSQTYVIMKRHNDMDSKTSSDGHEVFFRCGNWCYLGQVQFGNLSVGVADLPVIIPTLQKQQGSLRYYCNSNSIPKTSAFALPIKFLNEAAEFFASEMISDHISNELRKMSDIYSWIDDDNSSTYFEFTLSNVPDILANVGLIASKTYCRGLIIVSIYFESSIYFVVQGGEGEQPLLDIRFPDVSKHGQGLLLSTYHSDEYSWKKLTLWNVISTELTQIKRPIPKIKTISVANMNYEQTYCIMKSAVDAVGVGTSPTLSVHHDALFRFGSWCYSGRVQLIPSLSLSDVPFVIPALRMQQSRLDFLCDVNNIPTTSPFAPILRYIHEVAPCIENEIVNSEGVIRSLIERLSGMGLGDSIGKWLDGDSANSFFEFKLVRDQQYHKVFDNVDLVASKTYHASGIITITIVFQESIYVTVLDGTNENPLLDSRFPDVSGKGRGYQLASYQDGISDWPALRKVTVWQTVSALEEEFRERVSKFAQEKKKEKEELDPDGSTSAGDKYLDSEKSLGEEEDSDDRNIDAPPSRTGPSLVADEKHSSSSPSSSSSSASLAGNGGRSLVDRKDHDLTATLDEAVRVAAANNAASSKTSGSGTGTGANDAENEDGSSSSSSSFRNVRNISSVARPHHIPKLDSLSNKLGDIKKTLGNEGLIAPWDPSGKPLLGGLGKK